MSPRATSAWSLATRRPWGRRPPPVLQQPPEEGGAATASGLNDPRAIALDGSGDLYIAEFASGEVQRVDASTHDITRYAGGGSPASATATGARPRRL